MLRHFNPLFSGLWKIYVVSTPKFEKKMKFFFFKFGEMYSYDPLCGPLQSFESTDGTKHPYPKTEYPHSHPTTVPMPVKFSEMQRGKFQVSPKHKHDDVITWKHFPRYWPFVRPHKGQWRGALMFTLICARINGWVNNCEAGDLRRNRAHYDVIVMRKDRPQTMSNLGLIELTHFRSKQIRQMYLAERICTCICIWIDVFVFESKLNKIFVFVFVFEKSKFLFLYLFLINPSPVNMWLVFENHVVNQYMYSHYKDDLPSTTTKPQKWQSKSRFHRRQKYLIHLMFYERNTRCQYTSYKCSNYGRGSPRLVI